MLSNLHNLLHDQLFQLELEAMCQRLCSRLSNKRLGMSFWLPFSFSLPIIHSMCIQVYFWGISTFWIQSRLCNFLHWDVYYQRFKLEFVIMHNSLSNCDSLLSNWSLCFKVHFWVLFGGNWINSNFNVSGFVYLLRYEYNE